MPARTLTATSPRRSSRPLLRAAALLWLGAFAYPSRAETPVWFEDLPRKPPPNSAAAQAIAARMADILILGKAPADAAPLPPEPAAAPRIFFLSLADGKSPARVITAAGMGWAAAAEDALARARELMIEGFSPRLAKADVVGEIVEEKAKLATRFVYTREFYGLGFARETRVALLPEELVAASIMRPDEVLDARALQAHLKRRKPPFPQGTRFNIAPGDPLWRFKLESAWADGAQSGPLYRGHRIFGELDPEFLLASARAGGEYLTRAAGADGRFDGFFDPASGQSAEGYDILRHAGAVAAMLELYRAARDPELLRAAERGLAYLKTYLKPWNAIGGRTQVIVEEGKIKLGGVALAITALAEHAKATGDLSNLRLMQNLALWMLSVQRPNGEFAVHHQAYPGGEVSPERVEEYPGEAILALLRVHELDPLRGWSQYAHTAAQHLIESRDAGLSAEKLPHDTRLLMGLAELYREKKDARYLEHARKIARAIELSQLKHARYPDWSGGFFEQPGSGPAAMRAEGLLAAYGLERDFGEAARAEELLGAIRRSVSFQLQLQYRIENTMYLREPARALGGFRASFAAPRIRIDSVQNNISSLLGLRTTLLRAAGGGSNPG